MLQAVRRIYDGLASRWFWRSQTGCDIDPTFVPEQLMHRDTSASRGTVHSCGATASAVERVPRGMVEPSTTAKRDPSSSQAVSRCGKCSLR